MKNNKSKKIKKVDRLKAKNIIRETKDHKLIINKTTTPWLIGIDLDGTLLNDDGIISKHDVKVLNHLINAGHYVAIITGRPWRGTLPIYNQLGIKNSMVANYNGGFIHNPNDLAFEPLVRVISRDIVKDILESYDKDRDIINIVMEDNRAVVMRKRDVMVEKFFFFTNLTSIYEGDLLKHLIIDPLILIIQVVDYKAAIRIRQILIAKYNNALYIRLWPVKDGSFFIDMSSIGADKGTALKEIAIHYNVSLNHTLTFGNDFNDIELITIAEHGVAMKNAVDEVKAVAQYITKNDNNNSGVGKYALKFIENHVIQIENINK